MAEPDEVYRVYAIKYAHHERRSSENFIGGDTHDVPMPLDYFVWAVVGESRTFLVDTGFDQAGADKRGRVITRPIEDGLRAIGIEIARRTVAKYREGMHIPSSAVRRREKAVTQSRAMV